MGLMELPEIVKGLMKYYEGEKPARIVYKAGYSAHEKMIKTTPSTVFRKKQISMKKTSWG